MANNNIQVTHENIHTGLSGLNNDEKWKDLLNFRSAQGKTSVVPHKCELLNCEGFGLHTVITGLHGHNFVLGSEGAFGFVGADNLQPYLLWRLAQTYLPTLGSRDSQSQRLLIQGSYTGNEPIKLKVHYVAGKLVPFWDVPPVEAPVVLPVIDYTYGLGLDEFSFTLTVLDADDLPLQDVKAEFIVLGEVQYTVFTNGFGTFSIPNFLGGFYTIRLQKTGYTELSEDLSIVTTTTLTRTLTLTP